MGIPGVTGDKKNRWRNRINGDPYVNPGQWRHFNYICKNMGRSYHALEWQIAGSMTRNTFTKKRLSEAR